MLTRARSRHRWAQFLCVLGMLLTSLAVFAGERRVIVLREEGAIVRSAGDTVRQELVRLGLGESAVDLFDLVDADKATALVAALRRDGANIVLIALGVRAIGPALQMAGGRTVVVAVVSRASLEGGRYPADQVAAIVLDQPTDRLLNLVQVAMPGTRHVGVLAGSPVSRSIRQIEARASEHRLSILSESVGSADELVGTVERLAPQVEVMLAVPDPAVHSRTTILPLLLTTYRAGVPVIGYSESYLQAGAAFALYSTPAQIAQQTAEATFQVLEGKRPPAVQSPRYFTVGINSAVVRSLGIKLPAAAEIEQRLQSLER